MIPPEHTNIRLCLPIIVLLLFPRALLTAEPDSAPRNLTVLPEVEVTAVDSATVSDSSLTAPSAARAMERIRATPGADQSHTRRGQCDSPLRL